MRSNAGSRRARLKGQTMCGPMLACESDPLGANKKTTTTTTKKRRRRGDDEEETTKRKNDAPFPLTPLLPPLPPPPTHGEQPGQSAHMPARSMFCPWMISACSIRSTVPAGIVWLGWRVSFTMPAMFCPKSNTNAAPTSLAVTGVTDVAENVAITRNGGENVGFNVPSAMDELSAANTCIPVAAVATGFITTAVLHACGAICDARTTLRLVGARDEALVVWFWFVHVWQVAVLSSAEGSGAEVGHSTGVGAR